MTWISIAHLIRHFVYLKLTGIEQCAGMIQLVVKQITKNRVAVDLLKPNLQLILVESCNFC